VDDHLAQSAGLGVDSSPAVGYGDEGAAGGLAGLRHDHRVAGGGGFARLPAERPMEQSLTSSTTFVEQRINQGIKDAYLS
jgi:hypothetical protein